MVMVVVTCGDDGSNDGNFGDDNDIDRDNNKDQPYKVKTQYLQI